MNEDVFNASLRKFLKKVGVSSQREIEKAVREAIEAGRLKDHRKAAGENGSHPRRRQPGARNRRRDRTRVGRAKAPLRRAHHVDAKQNGGHAGALPTLRTRYSSSGFLPPMVLSLAKTASTLRSSRCFSVGSISGSLRVVSEAGSRVAPP